VRPARAAGLASAPHARALIPGQGGSARPAVISEQGGADDRDRDGRAKALRGDERAACRTGLLAGYRGDDWHVEADDTSALCDKANAEISAKQQG
jgi:hypothetical protein